jgi:uncharacterized protein YgbK (DUF1537 family)
MANNKIIVIDDDPTGSQTVHSCLLLTRWDEATLLEAFADESPLFFILSNTRGMSATDAASVTREICRNLSAAMDTLKQTGNEINPIVVSRSDSTLRGHYPVETDVIAEELGPFDAHFLVPAFFEGGRITRDSIHYLVVDSKPVRVDQTEFAKDSVFGFSTSFLPDYVEEKTAGRIRADQVERFVLDDIRGDCRQRLSDLQNNSCCVVDCETQSDLNGFASQLLDVAASSGKRFLFRSAASLLTAFAALPAQPVAANDMAAYVREGKPGVILAGSHVSKTSQQLNHLMHNTPIRQVWVDVEKFRDLWCAKDSRALNEYRNDLLEQITVLHESAEHVLVYTSRSELKFDNQQTRLDFGQALSAFLMQLVSGLPKTIGYLVSKGGITSNDVLSVGLSLRTSRVLGQILPGCSVVKCPEDHPRFANMPVVIFPGNVGDESSITRAFNILSGNGNEKNSREKSAA